jgi:hypothetical protein
MDEVQEVNGIKLYQVGKHAFDGFDLRFLDKQILWIVYDYENGSYEGSGTAIAFFKDGTLKVGDLGHCSCFGPLEHPSWKDILLIDLMKAPTNALDEIAPASVVSKVLEIVGGAA